MLKQLREIALLTAALLLGAYASTEAQTSTTRGFSLGFHAQGASLTVEDGEVSNGGGGGLRAGYGFNRIVTVFLEVDGASVDVTDAREEVVGQWTMAHVDLGARFHFANSLRKWVPYLEAALTPRAVGLEDTEGRTGVSFTGGGFTFGGGLSIYLKQTLALDTHLKFTSGEFTHINIGSTSVGGFDVDAKSTRFGLGLLWWL